MLGVNHSAQIDVVQYDMSVQKYEDGLAVDCSIQNYGPVGEDISIQKSTLQRNDVSVQPSQRMQDQSVSMVRGERSMGVQQAASVREHSNQFSISQQDEEMQFGVNMVDDGVQPTLSYHDYAAQPTLEL